MAVQFQSFKKWRGEKLEKLCPSRLVPQLFWIPRNPFPQLWAPPSEFWILRTPHHANMYCHYPHPHPLRRILKCYSVPLFKWNTSSLWGGGRVVVLGAWNYGAGDFNCKLFAIYLYLGLGGHPLWRSGLAAVNWQLAMSSLEAMVTDVHVRNMRTKSGSIFLGVSCYDRNIHVYTTSCGTRLHVWQNMIVRGSKGPL